MRRLFGALAVTAVAFMVSCDGDSDEGPDRETLQRKLAEARALNGPVQFWAGDSVGELALDDVDDDTATMGGGPQWTFFYGECEPLGGGETGCTWPLQVQNWSVCKRWPKRMWRLTELRGARAIWRWPIQGLEVVTGRTTVVIFAEDKGLAFKAAAGLRPVSATAPVAGLQPPAPGSLRGDLPCQKGTKRPVS